MNQQPSTGTSNTSSNSQDNATMKRQSEIDKRVKDFEDKREIGMLGAWSVSSCKAGFGVDQLRDDNLETYWQSDGTLPHAVNIQFAKRIKISHIYIHVDMRKDESYCPMKLSIKVGTNFHDLQEITLVTFQDPCGWQEIDLTKCLSESVYAHYLQLNIIENYQSGKDSHLRQIKIFSPRSSFLQEPDELPMKTDEFLHCTILR